MPKLMELPGSAVEAYEALSLPVWLFSVETLTVLWSNGAARAWLGYDAKTLHSMTIADLRPENERQAIAEHVRNFDGEETDAGLWTIISRSGDRHTISFTWRRVMFDGAEAIVSSIRDMTQVTRAHGQANTLTAQVEELRRRVALSHRQLSFLVDALPGKMLILTPVDYEIVAVTDEYAQAVMLDRETLLGRRLFDVLPDDPDEPDADGVRNLRASLKRVETLHAPDTMNLLRYPVRRPDGTFEERFWLPRNKPVFDDTGEIIFIVHGVEDITKLIKADNTGSTTATDESRVALLALQEREARLDIVERLLDLGAWEVDLEREQLSWSRRTFEIYGIPHERGAPNLKQYVELVPKADRPAMLSAYREFVTSGTLEIELQHRIVRGDGDIVHVRGVGTRRLIDGREIVIGFVQDITRYKKIEEEIRAASRRERLAGRLVRLGGWRVDLGETHVTWTGELAAIHDAPPGTTPTLEEAFDYYAPEHRDQIRTAFEACMHDGVPFDEVLQIITATGRRIWVRAIGGPVQNDEGEIIAAEGALQDISDLVEMRDETEALAQRLHHTLESISDAFFLLDKDWRFSFLNSQAELLLDRRREDLLGKDIWVEFPEAVSSKFEEQYKTAMAEGHAVRFKEYFDPLQTWFSVDAYPTPEGLAVYFRDVTEKQAREEQLRLLETAVSRQNDILVITEAEPIDGVDAPKIVYVNEAFEKRLGYSRREVIGKSPRILQGPRTQRSELDRIRHALEDWRPVRSELINYTKSGEEIWLELDIVPLADESGWFTHWLAIERDITKRKRVEDELKHNEERFRLIAKATGNAVWEWDIVGGTNWWSEGLGETFGHQNSTAAQDQGVWHSNIHPDDAARMDAELERLRLGHKDFMREHYRFRRADGSWTEVEDSAFVVRDTEGKVTRILGSMADISDRVHLQDRLRHAQKLEAVGQLTGGVAHDFNNLLTIIMGNAEVLEGKLNDQPQLKELADATINAAERGAELTSRLLAFSRKQPLSPRVVDMGKLIQGMDGMLRRTLPESIDVEIVRGGGLWQTEIDEGQLESAILNLALNARDAMPDGGSLTIETVNAVLDEDYVATEDGIKAGQYVMIVISDTGGGLAPGMLPRIFEPFFTTKQSGMGSGLGLSMVYGFVKQSGGHIRVYSELGEGTSFKLYFPRVTTSSPQAGRYRVENTITGGDETILVVEDDSAVRAYVTLQLKRLGYRICDAANGADALEILKQGQEVDLLFTDIVMPGGMNGSELASAARAMRPDLKVLFTSGYTENSIIHNGRLDPGVDLLSKPYRREQLAAKVRRILDSD